MHRLTLLTLITLIPATAAIQTNTGLLEGTPGQNPSIQIYKGIPYAAPPIADLRWRAPQPPTPWQGTRQANKFGPNCEQRSPNGGTFPPNGGDRPEPGMSEDCLYLNVYTPTKPNTKHPVMVWIHGGALVSGAGPIYNAEGLAAKGAIVVTINYRLGIFGFFAHPDLQGANFGFLDQMAALQWVQQNIAAFGGDAKNVTIFGESAGSWSVNYLTASPLAKGLFAKAIGESGAEFAPTRLLADAQQAGAKLGTLADLKSKPAEELNTIRGGYLDPVVDGTFLPAQVETIYAEGKQNDVPTLIGSNEDEGTLFTPAGITAATYGLGVSRIVGAEGAANWLKIYPAATDAEAHAAMAATIRDNTFGWEMRTWARLQTKTGKSKVYLYFFSHVPPNVKPEMGAQHGSEIAYVLNYQIGNDYDHKLADTISSYWYNFAATGDPNAKGLPTWPSFKTTEDKAMGFGDKIEVIQIPHKPALDLLDQHYEKLWQ